MQQRDCSSEAAVGSSHPTFVIYSSSPSKGLQLIAIDHTLVFPSSFKAQYPCAHLHPGNHQQRQQTPDILQRAYSLPEVIPAHCIAFEVRLGQARPPPYTRGSQARAGEWRAG